MKIYDISQEVFSCAVYPGHTAPERIARKEIRKGDGYELSDVTFCVHNGTHTDAPRHFIGGGKTIDQIELDRFIGYAYVSEEEGDLDAGDAERILAAARARDERAAERILIKGRAALTADAARVFAGAGIRLFGNESQSVGPESAPKEVHLIMLGAEIVLLEGVRLSHVPEGVYLLHAAPLDLGGCEGSPCRATLIGDFAEGPFA